MRGKPDEATPDKVTVDVAERGANGQTSSRRLFMQLQAFGGCGDAKALAGSLERSQIEAVLYADVHDSRGVGVLSFAEDPAFFVTRLREVVGAERIRCLGRGPSRSGRHRSRGLSCASTAPSAAPTAMRIWPTTSGWPATASTP